MAREIIIRWQDEETAFKFSKLERHKLYGKKRRVFLDADRNECIRANLSDDGSFVIRSGMTAQGYFTSQNRWVPNSDLVGLDDEGKVIEKIDSTIGVAQNACITNASDILDHQIMSVYMLENDEISDKLAVAIGDGSILKFPFNYRADYQAETAFLVANDDGIFALIGRPHPHPWCELESTALDEFDVDDDDELDFDFL